MSEHTGWEQQTTYKIYVRIFNRDCFVSGISIISVTILFSLQAKARRCLTYADFNHLDLRIQDRKVNSSNSLKIFHHNICRLRNKPDESLPKNRQYQSPHTCVGEPHMEEKDLLHITLTGYILQ